MDRVQSYSFPFLTQGDPSFKRGRSTSHLFQLMVPLQEISPNTYRQENGDLKNDVCLIGATLEHTCSSSLTRRAIVKYLLCKVPVVQLSCANLTHSLCRYMRRFLVRRSVDDRG